MRNFITALHQKRRSMQKTFVTVWYIAFMQRTKTMKCAENFPTFFQRKQPSNALKTGHITIYIPEQSPVIRDLNAEMVKMKKTARGMIYHQRFGLLWQVST